MSDPARAFGDVASQYAGLRPSYPSELYAFLVSHLSGARALCVDLGAGPGKASLQLAAHFTRVVAVEPDARMLAELPDTEQIEKRCASAEEADFAQGGVDCVTAATSFHWMEQDVVCARVARWLRPAGVFFPFLYGPFFVEGDGEDVFSRHWALWGPFRDKRLGAKAIYATPMRACGAFARLEMFSHSMQIDMTPSDAAGLFGTASYARAYARHHGLADRYVAQLNDELARFATIRVGFPLGGVLGVRSE